MNLTKLFSGTRINVSTAPGNEDLETGLAGFAFQDSSSRGWTTFGNFLDNDFKDLDKWLFGPHAVFAFRMDTKQVPSYLVRAHLDLRVRKWCRENGKTRCPSSVRGELRKQIEKELDPPFYPKTKIIPVLWALQDGWALIGTNSKVHCAAVAAQLKTSFDVDSSAWVPADWLGEGYKEAFEELGSPMHDFLTWMWYIAEHENAIQDWRVGIGDRLVMSAGPLRITLSGNGASASQEGATALKHQRQLQSIDVLLGSEEDEFRARVLPSLQPRGIKLPKVGEKGDGAVYAYLDLYGRLQEGLQILFTEFAQWRTGNWNAVVEGMKEWLEGK